MKQLFIIILSSNYSLVALDRPPWINSQPAGFLNDFYVGIGTSNVSESDARNIAIGDALQRIIQSGTITVKSSQEIKTQTTEQFKNGSSVSSDAVDKIVSELRIDGESQKIYGLKEEEYYSELSGGVFTVWSLVKIPKKIPAKESPPTQIDPLWRSMLAPGWGQFYKEEPTKGFLIAISIAALIPAGIVFDNLETTAQSDAKNSRTQVLRDYYVDQANTYKDLEIACFVTAGAIYVYNIVDALVSPGEKVYVMKENEVKPMLYVSLDKISLGLTMKF